MIVGRPVRMSRLERRVNSIVCQQRREEEGGLRGISDHGFAETGLLLLSTAKRICRNF